MTHDELKKIALQDKAVKQEYDNLELEFKLLKQIIEARKRLGLSQADIAELMQTKQASISRLESSLSSGTHSPSIATLKKYANAMGYNLDIKLTPL